MRKSLLEVQNRLFSWEYEDSKGFEKFVDEKLAHLPHAKRRIKEPVLIRYAGIFQHDKVMILNLLI
jgi:hypothetical protein